MSLLTRVGNMRIRNMTIKSATATVPKVPLWFYPIVVYFMFGAAYAFKWAALYGAHGAGSWFLAPQHSGAVGYTLGGVAVAGGIWLWAARNRIADRIAPFAKPSARYWLWSLLAVAGSLFLPAPFMRFIISLGLHGRNYDITDPATFVLITFYAVLIGPLCEEIVFRGFGMGVLIARGVNRWLAGGITLVLFLSIHWLPFGPGGVLLVLPFSILVTVLRIASGNLTPGLMLHMMNNTVAFLVLPLIWARQ